jgi:hypothetical protein
LSIFFLSSSRLMVASSADIKYPPVELIVFDAGMQIWVQRENFHHGGTEARRNLY